MGMYTKSVLNFPVFLLKNKHLHEIKKHKNWKIQTERV